MASETQNVIIVATPTSPLLGPLIHALSHQPTLNTTVLTRKTNAKIPFTSLHPSHLSSPSSELHVHFKGSLQIHEHNGHTSAVHIQTSFSPDTLKEHLAHQTIVICVLTGLDLHLSADIISSLPLSVQLFIPSEYGLDTSNEAIRALLPPYRMRFEIQELLSKKGVPWKAVYTGLCVEDALLPGGLLGIDALWGSATIFPPGDGNSQRIAISSYADVAAFIIDIVNEEIKDSDNSHERWACSARVEINQIIDVVEQELGTTLDRYEGDLVGARKEAVKRMELGFFDGGVALMEKVAVWDSDIDGWESWREEGKQGWEGVVKKIARKVKDGEADGGGCGC